MFQQLTSILPLATRNQIAICDTLDADASFMVHHFVSTALKERKTCVLVSFTQIFNHYLSIQKKLGNPSAASQIKFIDGLSLGSMGEDVKPFPKTSSVPTHAQSLSTFDSLLGLVDKLEQILENNEKAWVIVDDVSVLLSIGYTYHQVRFFVNRLYSVCQRSNSSCAILIHKDGMSDDPDLHNLVHHVIYHSNFTVETLGLASGMSQDIDGQIALRRGPLYTIDTRAQVRVFHPQTLHYKIMENTVRFIGKGLSSGVL